MGNNEGHYNDYVRKQWMTETNIGERGHDHIYCMDWNELKGAGLKKRDFSKEESFTVK